MSSSFRGAVAAGAAADAGAGRRTAEVGRFFAPLAEVAAGASSPVRAAGTAVTDAMLATSRSPILTMVRSVMSAVLLGGRLRLGAPGGAEQAVGIGARTRPVGGEPAVRGDFVEQVVPLEDRQVVVGARQSWVELDGPEKCRARRQRIPSSELRDAEVVLVRCALRILVAGGGRPVGRGGGIAAHRQERDRRTRATRA